MVTNPLARSVIIPKHLTVSPSVGRTPLVAILRAIKPHGQLRKKAALEKTAIIGGLVKQNLKNPNLYLNAAALPLVDDSNVKKLLLKETVKQLKITPFMSIQQAQQINRTAPFEPSENYLDSVNSKKKII